MKKWFLIILFAPYALLSQQISNQSQKWLDDNLKTSNVDSVELIGRFKEYNFSRIWLFNQESNLGYIGSNYQRFFIHFSDIVKKDPSSLYYFVTGKTKVRDNICVFKGEIKILHIREINKTKRKQMLKDAIEHNDSNLIKRAKYEQYILLAEYKFFEDDSQKYSGIFTGTLKTHFFIDNDSLFYDNLDRAYSDIFANNQFVGNWKDYQQVKTKICNWGHYRIPYSGDLDIGVGYFSPNDRYLMNGWENYYKAYIIEDRDALEEEKKKWW